jgi:hypothetical protein
MIDGRLEVMILLMKAFIDSYVHRSFGWVKRGTKVYGEVSGKRFARESL